MRLRTALVLSLEGLFSRQTGGRPPWRQILRQEAEDLQRQLGGSPELAFTALEQIETVRFLSRQVRRFERNTLSPPLNTARH